MEPVHGNGYSVAVVGDGGTPIDFTETSLRNVETRGSLGNSAKSELDR
jgi:hypothetical protein